MARVARPEYSKRKSGNSILLNAYDCQAFLLVASATTAAGVKTGMLEKPGVFMADVFEFPDFLFGVLQSVPPNPKSRL